MRGDGARRRLRAPHCKTADGWVERLENSMLEMKKISKVVGGETHILPTDLVLERGSLNVLLGPTLSGKTSLMRLMAGLDKPDLRLADLRRHRRHRPAGAEALRSDGLPAVHQLPVDDRL